MNPQTTHFTVMVPVYNTELYVGECIQSVLDQTYQDFELILVDDGSPDGSGAICDRYAEKDPRVKVYHTPNRGALHARCYAISQAAETGYGLFLDSDDLLRPNALQTIHEKILRYRSDCIIFSMEEFLDGVCVGRSRNLAEEDVVLQDKRELYRAVLLGEDTAFYSMCRKAVRIELLSRDPENYAPYHHIFLGEDRLHSLEIYWKSRTVCFIPDVLYDRRIRPGSAMNLIPYEKWRVDFTLYETEERFLREQGVFTPEDFAEYRTRQIHCVAGDLVRIAGMDTSRKNRIGLYEKMRETAYCKALMAGGAYDRKALGRISLIYDAFCRGQYDLIFLLRQGLTVLQRLRGR